MQTANLLPLILVLALVAYGLAYMRSRAVAAPLGGIRNLKALPFIMRPGLPSGAAFPP